MQRYARLGVAKVKDWNDQGKLRGGLEVEPQSQMEEGHVVVDGTDWIRRRPCDTPSCGKEGNGHQCEPSALTFVARSLLRGVRAAYLA